MTGSPDASFAAALLRDTRRRMEQKALLHRQEVARHEREMAALQRRIAALEWMGGRTRRQVLGDVRTPDDVLDVLLDCVDTFTLPEVKVLLSRPHTDKLAGLVTTVLNAERDRNQTSYSGRRAARVRRMLDLLLDVDVWPPAYRLAIALSRPHVATIDHVADRARTSADVGLMVGLFLGPLPWRGNRTVTSADLAAVLRDVPLVRLGMAMATDHVSAEVERGFRDRLAKLPVEVAARLAGELPVRTERGEAAVRARLELLETLVAGVTAQPV